jgi:hypothetical protein
LQASAYRATRRSVFFSPLPRREEVALLANVGFAWYTALEQGREIRPSVGVLEGLACALRLKPDEREYLFLLADQPIPAAPPNEEIVSPAVRRVIDVLAVALPTCLAGAGTIIIGTRLPGCGARSTDGDLYPDARGGQHGQDPAATGPAHGGGKNACCTVA